MEENNLIDKIEIIEIDNGWIVTVDKEETKAFLAKELLLEYLDRKISE